MTAFSSFVVLWKWKLKQRLRKRRDGIDLLLEDMQLRRHVRNVGGISINRDRVPMFEVNTLNLRLKESYCKFH